MLVASNDGATVMRVRSSRFDLLSWNLLMLDSMSLLED